MTDPLDRVEDAYTDGWAEAIKEWREDGPSVEPHRQALRAALRVMGDEIRQEHIPYPIQLMDGTNIYHCETCGERWPCTTIRIIDNYVGEQND